MIISYLTSEKQLRELEIALREAVKKVAVPSRR
jgi:hypothetical protein